ncbi:MAG: TolB family protein [Planctomycetota bacterium]
MEAERLLILFLAGALPALAIAGCASSSGDDGGARRGDRPVSGEEETAEQAAESRPRGGPTGAATLPLARPTHARERHLRNLRQLTDGGENAEAYFSSDGARLIFQSTRPPRGCDQIFTMKTDGSDLRLVSTGLGRTTCAYFQPPDDDRIVYSSTHLGSRDCPPTPDHSMGYVWPIYDSYEIFAANADGTGLTQLTRSPGYDAEATFSPDGSRIVFTSTRDGDLNIYSMAADGTDVRRLTRSPGYDGGPFYSLDGSMICYRGRHPQGQELEDYQELLGRGLVRPSKLEIFVMDANGTNSRQVTSNGAANFCPFFHPDGDRIIFSSNLGDPRGREFDLYIIRIDGTGLERITHESDFDGFPMFSPDGKKLVWCSNRFNSKPRETNVYIADWVDSPPAPPRSSQ